MSMTCRAAAVLFAALVTSCSLPEAVARLEDHAPAPDLGRPAWVQGVARAGAYAGGVIGAAGALIAYPVFKGLSLAAGDALGADADELVWAPVSIGAGAGHVVLGVPCDALSYVFSPSSRITGGPAIVEATPPVGPGPVVRSYEAAAVDASDGAGGAGS
ncbi:MAG: hypothetical protein O2865_09690 [Planctomycetota bacterium]|nr:hypothetical protein [Planctomycetota bacterium]